MVLKRRWGQRRFCKRFKNSNFNYLAICRDDIKTLFCECEGKPSKRFHFEVCHMKQFRKWFWSYLQAKNEYSERLKIAFLIWVEKLKWFSEKVRQTLQDHLNQSLLIGSILKKVLKLPWGQKRMFWTLAFFRFLQILEWLSWNRFNEKWGKVFKTV